jgi:multisubunit Na+/H+ antiporter MnhB subunit
MPFIVGLIIVAAIIYFAFIMKPGDTRRDALKKIAQTVLVLVIVLVVAFIFFITRHKGG